MNGVKIIDTVNFLNKQIFSETVYYSFITTFYSILCKEKEELKETFGLRRLQGFPKFSDPLLDGFESILAS